MTDSPHHDEPSPADDVFVSPRVVDERAFEDFAGSLREVIREANSSVQGLRQQTESAQQTLETITESAAAFESRLEKTAALVQQFERRAAEVERTLSDAAGKAGQVEQIESRVRRAVDEQLAGLNQRAEQAMALAVAKIEGLTSDLDERIADTRRTIESEVDAPKREIVEIARGARAQVDASRAEIDDATRTIAAQIDRAVAVIGRAPERTEGPVSAGSLLDVVTRAEHTQQTATAAMNELAEIKTSAETMRSTLAADADAATSRLGKAVESAKGIADTADKAVERARTAEQGLDQQAQRVKQTLEMPMQQFRVQAEQMGQGVQMMLQQTEQTRRAGEQTAREAHTLLEKLEQTATRLEPWRAVVLGGDTDAMPEPIRRLIESVRRELGRDLSTLAGTLSDMGTRADRLAREAAQSTEPARPAATIEPKPAETKPQARETPPPKAPPKRVTPQVPNVNPLYYGQATPGYGGSWS